MKTLGATVALAAAVLLAACAGVIPPPAPLPADAAVNKSAAQETFMGADPNA